MHITKIKRVMALVALVTVTGLAPVYMQAASTVNSKSPDLPSPLCDRVQVGPENKLSSHVYATGVQVYRWDGLSWVFVEPIANLFANANYDGKIGTHFRGPTWKSNSGSQVVGARLAGCTPDPTAIPWLKLEAVSTSGPGIFSSVAYIQRTNTTGGLAPTFPGSAIGEVVEIPYTAEYYFYRGED
ncbi:MAG TPA: DUF3455 domain-containing protein [Pyrinomonadaceae bacterium]|nr:DUF3455 domain-containing protein [Pyrinomonadaceae bacterium]